MSKRKILFFINALNRGGAEVALINFLNNLDYKKYEVDLLVYEKESELSVENDVNKKVSLKRFSRKTTNANWIWKKLCHLIHKQKMTDYYQYAGYDLFKWGLTHYYDIAICYGEWFPNYFIAEALKARKKVFWIHNDLSKSIYLENSQRFVNGFDLLIFPSKSAQDSSLKKMRILNKKSVVVPYIFNFKKIRNLSQQKIDLENEKNKFLIVTVANFRKQKNYHRCLKVAHLLKQSRKNFRWLAVGQVVDEELFEDWKRLRKKLKLENDFLFLGPKDNPYPYIKKANLFALLSDYEGKPLVVSEAKFLNIPVMATKTSGTIELIDSGNNGLLVDFNEDDIFQLMVNVIDNKNILNKIKINLKKENFSSLKNSHCDWMEQINH